MNLYFVRHGEAEPILPGKADKERTLTSEGKEIIKSSAAFWKNYVTGINIIVCSPMTRAVQTAGMIKDIFNITEEVIKDNSLLNGKGTKDLITTVNSLNVNNLLLVGHQPDLAIHTSNLVSSSILNMNISPGTIIKITFEGKVIQGKGTLGFVIPPIKKG